MMADQFRKVEPYSPKSSPRGGRSPVVSSGTRIDSSGTLKTTISLGPNPSIVHSGPFYLMKEPPGKYLIPLPLNSCLQTIPQTNNTNCFAGECELTGATNLMAFYGLEHSYSKFNGKKLKESLSSFLPNLPGILDGPGQEDNSTLGSVIAKRPIGGKELLPLTSAQLAGFRLHPGPLPEQYRYVSATPPKRHKSKHKKHKHKDGAPPGQDTPLQGMTTNIFSMKP